MKVILASQSPRRRELLAQMGIRFEVVVRPVDESFPEHLNEVEAVRYIAKKKADAFTAQPTDALVITADTVVAIDGSILGKPADGAEAASMLARLSGKKHEVITAVALLHQGVTHVFHEVTEVYFRAIHNDDINHYIQHYQPFDKAGAYGIQEWIGSVAIERIVGSYTNVVGLPTAMLFGQLKAYGIWKP